MLWRLGVGLHHAPQLSWPRTVACGRASPAWREVAGSGSPYLLPVAEPEDEVTQAGVATALALASDQGLRVLEPRVVSRGSNRIIWLCPAPIVARVMTGTAVRHADPEAWLAREIDVGTFLAGAGAPIVPPVSVVDPGPHLSGGLWISLWEHVEVVPAAVPAGEVGRSLRSLHGVMVGYPGRLPLSSTVLAEIDWLLAALNEHAGLAALVEERDRLAPLLSQGDTAGQPLHGEPRFRTCCRRAPDRGGTTSRTCALARRHGT